MSSCYHLDKRIFYVHIPKCAGTSIGGRWNPAQGVWSNCWLEENLPGWSRENLPNGHQPVRAIEQSTGRPLDWWDTILVTIRNPFAQQVSQWEFWRKRALAGAAKGYAYHQDDRFAVSCTFPQFVSDDRSNGPNATCGARWREAGGVFRWWCSDSRGHIPENVKIVRVEDIEKGALRDVLAPHIGDAQLSELPVSNTATQRPWEEYYDAPARRAVARKFSWSLASHYPDLIEFGQAAA